MRRFFGSKKKQLASDSRRRTSSAGRPSLRIEPLEPRWVLSAAPMLIPIADQMTDEGATLNLVDIGTFSDIVEGTTGGGSTIGLNPDDFMSLGAFDPAANVVFDTDLLTIDGVAMGTTVAADTGSGLYDIAVFTFDSFELDAGITLTAIGSLPLAILSQAGLSVFGTIDVSATSDGTLFNGERIAGAGGGNGGLGSSVFPAPPSAEMKGEAATGAPLNSRGAPASTGGGTGGGHGGNGGRSEGGGARGAAFGDLQLGIQGGSGGGTADEDGINALAGGGGGGGGIELGAIHSILIAASGQVLANGGDGAAHNASNIGLAGGGGGGAGGGILLHASLVTQLGLISAVGGQGGISESGGGGGGGGQILIAYSDTNSDLTGTTDASGGAAAPVGENGFSGDDDVVIETPTSVPVIESYGFSIDWGDGSLLETGAATIDTPGVDIGDTVLGSFNGIHTYADDGSYTVTLSVISDTGANPGETTDTEIFLVTVDNLDPLIAADSALVTINEGQTATNSGTFSDVPADTVTLSASIGTIVDNLDGTWGWSFTGTDDLTTAVVITATDDDGGASSTGFNLVVNNVDPVVAADNAMVTIDEGQLATNTGTFSDVPADTVTLLASIGTVVDNLDGTWGWSFTGTDDLTTAVVITATDDDGGASSTSFNLVVDNVAPVLANVATDSPVIGGAVEGDTVTLTADFTDAGLLDTHTAVIDWGDGTTSSAGVVDQLLGSVTGDHVYANGGIYEVTLTLTDDDTGEATEATAAVVAGVGVQDGVLQAVGTSGDDFVKVFRSYYSGDYKVLFRLDGGSWTWRSFDSSSVNEIKMLLGDGDDIGFISRNVYINATIDAGDGDDLLGGGSGDDVLLAGAGYDILFGGNGRDLMIGGTGSDLIFGDGGSDILISGTTAFDNDPAALDAIMAEWTSERTYQERSDNLRGIVGDTFDDRENGEFFLIAEGPLATVFDDESVDWLIGGRGRDLYFAGDDDISFSRFFEIIEEIEAEAPA